jgi:hypothetical protein
VIWYSAPARCSLKPILVLIAIIGSLELALSVVNHCAFG